MAVVHPFKGLRYNKLVVTDLNRVVAQPYDKTTPSMQDAYCRISPYNVVRITLNPEKRTDPATAYPAAGATFRQWIEQGVLVQDAGPAFYAYAQEYAVDGDARLQRGFIALLDLENSESGIVPHENTLTEPKQDRLRLIRSLEGNEDLIYMLYADDAMGIDRVLDRSLSGRAPEIEVTDEYGAIHRLWSVADAESVVEIRDGMRSRKLFIADGHHRFETSVNYMKECRRRGWGPIGVESYDKRMVACFNLAAGVTILPTHRLIRDLPAFDAGVFLRAAAEDFSVETVPSAAALWGRMREGRAGHAIGFYPAKHRQFYLLSLKRESPENTGSEDLLDVRLLHSLLLERGLGIDAGRLEAQSNIDYERDRDAGIRRVDAGEHQAAFFLNPTTADQVQRIASSGARMPQKSTDFYPKLLTGLIFMRMNIRK